MTDSNKDPLVQLAVAHFAARYEANGVIAADFRAIGEKLTTWDGWCATWSEAAARHEELGDKAASVGDRPGMGEHYARAALYYHYAKYLFVRDMDQVRAAHAKALACHARALPHMSPPAERVEIPYEGKVLAAILRRPSGVAKPPVAILLTGLDSAKEEMDSFTTQFVSRGVATLVIDGPGQGEAEYTIPIRHDYEHVITPAIDWLESRDDVDGRRVALWGISLGGYYAPRAAAFEPRVRACVSIGAPYDWSDNWEGKPFLTREVFRVRSHSATAEEARAKAALLSLADVAERIECPLYVVGGSRDMLCTPAEQARLAREARGDTILDIIEGGDHVCHNKHYMYRPQTAAWIAARLAR